MCLLLARTLSMSTTVADCGTKHLVEYEVKTKKHLNKLNGKYYKLNEDDETEDLKLLDASKDSNLIGKHIYVRSAATCALGDQVCPRCMGSTATLNIDIADGVSAYESEEITKVVNQNILSAKHLLATNSEVIKFNKEFYDFFTMLGGEINPVVNNNDKIPNIEDYAIYIDDADIVKMDEQDYDSLYNTCIENGRFYIKNIKDPSQPVITIQSDPEKEIFLSEDALSYKQSGKGLIYFKDLNDDVKLFEVVILNKELTKPLYDIMNLLNKQKSEDISESIDSISQKFLDLLIESNIGANVIAAELIINRLIRSVKHKYERPDFRAKKLEPYQIYTIKKALEQNKSPLIGISFQDIKRQLLSDDILKRDGTSFIDPFYWTHIPTKNLKKYGDLAERVVRDDDDKDDEL